MASVEIVAGSLEGVSYQSFDTVYDLLFTTERVVAVIIQDPIDFSYNKPGFEQLLLGDLLARRREHLEGKRIAAERRRAIQEKSLGELIASHRSNFEIRYDAVTSVELTRRLLHPSLNFYLAPSSPTTRICFTLTKGKVPTALYLLNLVLPTKVKRK